MISSEENHWVVKEIQPKFENGKVRDLKKQVGDRHVVGCGGLTQ